MSTATQASSRLVVRQDLRAIREVLLRIRQSERLAPLNLFGRRSPVRMLDYLDRRSCDRAAVELPIYLKSVAFDGHYAELDEDCEPERLALTRDVSLRGIGLAHDEPLEANHAVLTFELADGEQVSLLLDVRWANLERGFRYLSGGRFIGIVEDTQ